LIIKNDENITEYKEEKILGKVMIVDDELDLREMLVIMFQNEGFETETAKDGSDFLHKIDTFKPELVILDIMMPGLPISEILRKLRKKESKPKIILLSVVRYSEDEIKKLFKMGKIVEYIKKPFEIDTLMTAVKKHVGTI